MLEKSVRLHKLNFCICCAPDRVISGRVTLDHRYPQTLYKRFNQLQKRLKVKDPNIQAASQLLFDEVINPKINLFPLCPTHHQGVDRLKVNDGFLSRHPLDDRPDLMLLQLQRYPLARFERLRSIQLSNMIYSNDRFAQFVDGCVDVLPDPLKSRYQRAADLALEMNISWGSIAA